MAGAPGLWFPRPFPWNSNAPTYVNHPTSLMTGSADRFAVIFQCPKAGTLDRVEMVFKTVLQAPTNGIRISFQDLSSGNPDGTEDQYRVVTGISAGSWLVSGLITSDGTDGGTKRTVSRNDWLSIVVKFESFNSGDWLQPSASNFTSGGGSFSRTPYTATSSNSGSTWAKATGNCNIALKYDDGTYGYLGGDLLPFATLPNVLSFNSGSSPDEIGNRVVLPLQMKVKGAWAHLASLGGACDLVIYDSSNTVMHTEAMSSTNTTTAEGLMWIPFSTDVELPAATYRVVLKPGASNVQPHHFTVNSAPIMDAIDDGSKIYRTHRTDAGSWTDTDTDRILIGLDGSFEADAGGTPPATERAFCFIGGGA